jgi:type I restriction enzyme, S subunit
MTRRYPVYRDSGVEWLGDVPEGWELSRLGACFSERRENVSDKDYPALSVTMGGIVPQLETAAKTNDGDNRKLVREGDFVINSRSDRKGSSGLSKLDGSVSLISIVITPRPKISGPFSNWLLKSKNFQEEFYRWGSGIVADLWSTRYGAMSAITLAIPSLPEQTDIAAFLDRETAKIDALVAEQRRLIDLLKEKRQAVISHAVTRGLNPNAPLKPSGVDWLGDVPEGWEVVPLKYLVSHVVDCLHTTPTYDGELIYPAVRTADVDRGRLLIEQIRLVSEEIYMERIQRLKPEPGDIVYSREGERLGMAALIPDGVDLCLGQRMMMFRTMPSMCPAFLMWALNSEPTYQQVMEKNIGSTSPHVNIGDVINFRFPCAPLSEQKLISEYITKAVSQIDALTTTAQSAITLLQERRAALISAAVTGKIDVRALAPSETEAA